MTVCFEQSQEILDFANEILGEAFTINGVRIISDLDASGDVKCVVVFKDINDAGCEMSIASSPDWSMTRFYLKVLFTYAFLDRNHERAMAITSVTNEKAQKFLERVGFTREFDKPMMHWDGRDKHAYSYVMFKEDCKWIREVKNG